MKHTLDLTAFRALFPAFNAVDYPDQILTAWWDFATCAVDSYDNCELHGKCLQNVLYLMLAHIAFGLMNAANGSSATGVATSASIDKVSVGYAPPPFKTGWQAWLSTTPYGLQLWALLQALSSGGFYVNGRPEASSFRKVAGYF